MLVRLLRYRQGDWIKLDTVSLHFPGSLTYCYYPDGGVTTCTSWACEYTPPRVVIHDHRTPAPTDVMAPEGPSVIIFQPLIQTPVLRVR